MSRYVVEVVAWFFVLRSVEILTKKDIETVDVFKIMCSPPVMVFYAVDTGRMSERSVSVVSLRYTAPLMMLDAEDRVVNTKWVHVKQTDPEVLFLKRQKGHLDEVRRALRDDRAYVGVRYDCRYTRDLFCTVVHNKDAQNIIVYNVDGDNKVNALDGGHSIRHLARGSGVDILVKHMMDLYRRWSQICATISQVSIEDYVDTAFWEDTDTGSIVCEMTSPSPMIFWLSITTDPPAGSSKNTPRSVSSAFYNNTSTARLNVSHTNARFTCEIQADVGWTIRIFHSTSVRQLGGSVFSVEDDLFPFVESTSIVDISENNPSTRKYAIYSLFVIPSVLLVVSCILIVFRDKIRLILMERTVRKFRRRTHSISRSEFRLSFR